MAMEGKLIAGYVLLAVGALLIVVAIILIIYLLHRRRVRKEKRPYSPDAFKVVYKTPTDNGSTLKLAPRDTFDSRSVHTLRSEAGYKYAAPPPRVVPASTVPPIIYNPDPVLAAPSIISGSQTLPRSTSFEHVAVTLPRTGERYIVPAPNGTLPRILVPVDKKKEKQYKKARLARHNYYGADSRSVMSMPSYVTLQRPRKEVTRERRQMYGSTPNLTQPVLMYDRGKQRLFSDDMAAANTHVRNWLTDDELASFSGEEVDHHARPRSRASSAPTDLDQLNAQTLHMRWSPSMRRRLAEMDQRESEDRRRAQEQLSGADLQQEIPVPGARRYQPLHHYTELSEEF